MDFEEECHIGEMFILSHCVKGVHVINKHTMFIVKLEKLFFPFAHSILWKLVINFSPHSRGGGQAPPSGGDIYIYYLKFFCNKGYSLPPSLYLFVSMNPHIFISYSQF